MQKVKTCFLFSLQKGNENPLGKRDNFSKYSWNTTRTYVNCCCM